MATSLRRSTDRARQAGPTSSQLAQFTKNYRKSGQISFPKGVSKAARNGIRQGMAQGMSARAAKNKGDAAATSYYSGSKDRRAASRAPVERRGGRDRRDRRQG